MRNFKRILFATDFSSAAAHALSYAISLALEHESMLFLVHVIEEDRFSPPYSFGSRPVQVEYGYDIEERSREELSKHISPQVKRQIHVEEILLKGKPYVEIIRTAREKNADLIVIPTHGHAGIKHSHLGSTADRVIRKAPCPVLVIRHPEFEFTMP
jgi:nucleotide-binding universal stress UspA family protein